MVQEPTNFGVFSDGQTPIASGLNTGGWRTYIKFIVSIFKTVGTGWGNMPAALTEIFANEVLRETVDLTYVTQFRLIINVTTLGSVNAELGVQYSTDSGTNFNGLDNGTQDSNSTVTASLSATGHITTAWTDLASGARADILLRIMGENGDGVADPAVSTVEVQFR